MPSTDFSLDSTRQGKKISDVEKSPIEISQNEIQREKNNGKTEQTIQEQLNNFFKCNRYNWNTRMRRERERVQSRRNFQTIIIIVKDISK